MLSDFTADIRALSQAISRSALNAQVQASRCQQGQTLDVLAERTRQVASETIRDVDLIAGKLQDLLARVSDLDERLTRFVEVGHREQAVLQEEARIAGERLRAMQDGLTAGVENIRAKSLALAGAAAAAKQLMCAPQYASDCVKAVVTTFDLLAQEAASYQTLAETQQIQKAVQTLRSRYTMSNERSCHDSVPQIVASPASAHATLSTSEAATPPPEGVMKSAEGGEIELF
jgi:hypothetical protein